jgi:hypothetical protein
LTTSVNMSSLEGIRHQPDSMQGVCPIEIAEGRLSEASHSKWASRGLSLIEPKCGIMGIVIPHSLFSSKTDNAFLIVVPGEYVGAWYTEGSSNGNSKDCCKIHPFIVIVSFYSLKCLSLI